MRAAYSFNMINSNMINSRWAFEPEDEGNVQNYFLTFMQIFYVSGKILNILSKWEIIKGYLLMSHRALNFYSYSRLRMFFYCRIGKFKAFE